MKTQQQNTAATYGSGITMNAIFGFDSYGNQVQVLSAGQTVWELTGVEGKVTTTRSQGYVQFRRGWWRFAIATF